MKQELMLWRFCAGVFGGWLMVAMFLLAIIGGYVCVGLAAGNRLGSATEIAAMLSGAVFLGMALSFTVLRAGLRSHPLAQLAPGVRQVATALMRRLALMTLIALPPAVALQALVRTNITLRLDVRVGLSDVAMTDYSLTASYLACVAVAMAITFGPLKVPVRFATMPLYFGAFAANVRSWSWFPFAACAVLVVGYWFWRYFGAQLSLSPPPSSPKGRAGVPRSSALSLWWQAQHVQRIVRAHAAGDARARVTALLATQSTSSFTVASIIAATLYLALKPGFMDTFVVSWLMALPIAVLLSMPPAIPLSRIMLLPLGAERARVGQIIAAVWARQIRTRLLICVAGGLLLHALFWWLEWPAFIRSPFFTPVDPATHLLWSPLAQAAGLYGMAMSACLLATASPRLLQRSGFLLVVPWLALIGLAALSLPLKWWLNDAIPATAGQDMGHITFAIVNGVMLPACAWCIHRALRYQWSRANLAAISAAMQKWSTRLQKAHSME